MVGPVELQRSVLQQEQQAEVMLLSRCHNGSIHGALSAWSTPQMLVGKSLSLSLSLSLSVSLSLTHTHTHKGASPLRRGNAGTHTHTHTHTHRSFTIFLYLICSKLSDWCWQSRHMCKYCVQDTHTYTHTHTHTHLSHAPDSVFLKVTLLSLLLKGRFGRIQRAQQRRGASRLGVGVTLSISSAASVNEAVREPTAELVFHACPSISVFSFSLKNTLPQEKNWEGGVFFFFFFSSVLCVFWAWWAKPKRPAGSHPFRATHSRATPDGPLTNKAQRTPSGAGWKPKCANIPGVVPKINTWV